MRVFLLISAMCLFAPLTALGRPVPVGTDAPVLVIVPPWLDASQVVLDAGGQVIGLDKAPFGVLAIGMHPDFNRLLRHSGAWAVRDGTLLAGLC